MNDIEYISMFCGSITGAFIGGFVFDSLVFGFAGLIAGACLAEGIYEIFTK